MKKLILAMLLIVAALSVAACGDDDDTSEPTETPAGSETPAPGTDGPTASPAPTDAPTDEPSAADCSANEATAFGDITWESVLPDGDLPAPDGWTVSDAEGDAPLLDVNDGSGSVGVVELLQFPLDSPLDGIEALKAWADEYYAGVETDRQVEYGDGYTVTPREAETVKIGEFCGIVYGFDGADENGEVVDRVAGVATFDSEGKLYLFAASYDAATAAEMGFADAESLETYGPYLIELVESLTLA